MAFLRLPCLPVPLVGDEGEREADEGASPQGVACADVVQPCALAPPGSGATPPPARRAAALTGAPSRTASRVPRSALGRPSWTRGAAGARPRRAPSRLGARLAWQR